MSDDIYSDCKYPHCDSLVLHAPGACVYCDHYPERQKQRIRDRINFTGCSTPGWEKCPAERRRPLATVNRWGGNVAVTEAQLLQRDAAWAKILAELYPGTANATCVCGALKLGHAGRTGHSSWCQYRAG